MRRIIGLLLLFALAGCPDPASQSGKKYLFDTERCADVGPEDSAEYKDCEKKLAEQDAKRFYNLNNGGQTVPISPSPPVP